MLAFLRAVFIPAAVFQSVIVGGAYGTGREVVEYVSQFGPTGGLASIAAIAISFGLILAVSFEFARTFKTWDYRRFLRQLLGRGWVIYEILFIALLVVVLAITASASGEVLHDQFSIPAIAGTGLMFLAVVILNFYGRTWVNKMLTLGAILLVIVLVIYVGLVFSQAQDVIAQTFTGSGGMGSGWLQSGITFAVYNSALIPAIIYCAANLQTRTQAIAAGLIAGLMGSFPALVFHISFMAGYPAVIDQEIPTYWMIEHLGFSTLLTVYTFVLFATIVQTGVGILQGFNERLDGWYRENTGATSGKSLPAWAHAMIAGGLLLASLVLAKFGIVDLVAKGYSTLAWGFFVVFTIPMLTLGIAKLYQADKLKVT